MNWSREFSSSDYFFLIFFIIIYLIYFLRIYFITRKFKTTANSSFIKLILRTLYFGALSLALLGPSFGKTELEARASAKEIYLAFDLSLSMNSNDVAPSRIDKAKGEILSQFENLKTHKVGLIAFNSEAQLLLPLTYDHETIKNRILNLKPSDLSKGSSELNSLFELLNIKFANPNVQQTKICILITDGEFFIPTDQELLKNLKNNHINLAILAVGTQMGGKIPLVNGFKTDKNGDEVVSFLDIKQIAELAKNTNGNYFILNNQKNESDKLIDYIGTLKTIGNIESQSVTYNKYMYFLLIAIGLLSLDYLLTINVIKL